MPMTNSLRTTASSVLDLPDALIAEAYHQAATKSVLAALKPDVFFGYFSVCADGKGHGGNTTFPGLDWGQSAEALLWLGREAEVFASWDYVKSFQRADGLLPFAILPGRAGLHRPFKTANHEMCMKVELNGAVYDHCFPGSPFRALANITFIQVADALFNHTGNCTWLERQVAELRSALDWLRYLIRPTGLIEGRGFYIERPFRHNHDGVDQAYAGDAFEKAALLLDAVGESADAADCSKTAVELRDAFSRYFWAGDHCVEYIHPDRGPISNHGLTDVDWIAVAMDLLDPDRRNALWPQLRDNEDFLYDGVPTGISTRPESYEPWSYYELDRHDLAAMGRVWYLEAWARWRMRDGEGLAESIRRVARVGQANDWYWMERYYSQRTGDLGIYRFNTYVEYPANLIRIIQQFLMGVTFSSGRELTFDPVVPQSFWISGFGQTLQLNGAELSYRLDRSGITGQYRATHPLRLKVRSPVISDLASGWLEVALQPSAQPAHFSALFP